MLQVLAVAESIGPAWTRSLVPLFRQVRRTAQVLRFVAEAPGGLALKCKRTGIPLPMCVPVRLSLADLRGTRVQMHKIRDSKAPVQVSVPAFRS